MREKNNQNISFFNREIKGEKINRAYLFSLLEEKTRELINAEKFADALVASEEAIRLFMPSLVTETIENLYSELIDSYCPKDNETKPDQNPSKPHYMEFIRREMYSFAQLCENDNFKILLDLAEHHPRIALWLGIYVEICEKEEIYPIFNLVKKNDFYKEKPIPAALYIAICIRQLNPEEALKHIANSPDYNNSFFQYQKILASVFCHRLNSQLPEEHKIASRELISPHEIFQILHELSTTDNFAASYYLARIYRGNLPYISQQLDPEKVKVLLKRSILTGGIRAERSALFIMRNILDKVDMKNREKEQAEATQKNLPHISALYTQFLNCMLAIDETIRRGELQLNDVSQEQFGHINAGLRSLMQMLNGIPGNQVNFLELVGHCIDFAAENALLHQQASLTTIKDSFSILVEEIERINDYYSSKRPATGPESKALQKIAYEGETPCPVIKNTVTPIEAEPEQSNMTP